MADMSSNTTKDARITFRATSEMAAAIERYRAWLEAKELDRVPISRAVAKLIRVGLEQFQRGQR